MMEELDEEDSNASSVPCLYELERRHTDRVTSIVQAGDEVWSASSSGRVLVHDRRGTLLDELKIPSRGLTVDYASCMVFVAGADEVWCGLSSGGVCTYKKRALAEESEDGHLGPVTCMAWSERAKLMWTGGGDGKLISWSAADKRRQGSLEGHADWVRCLLVCNGRLWSGSDDKTIRIWNESGSTPQV
jgi:WD40 repeat protein